jgi:D-sedoheptulose 7-phosphate isomerase
MKENIEGTIDTLKLLNTKEYTLVFDKICDTIVKSIKNNKKIILVGNGGSASDCSHIAAEFVNKFKIKRRPYNAIALTTDNSIMTCIANDLEFNEIFNRQLQGLGYKNDVLISLSTSGKSKNLLNTINTAKEMGIKSRMICGNTDEEYADITFKIPSKDSAIIQNCYMVILHAICDECEKKLL